MFGIAAATATNHAEYASIVTFRPVVELLYCQWQIVWLCVAHITLVDRTAFTLFHFDFFYDNFGFFRSFLMKSRKGGTSYHRLNFVDLCYSRRRSKIHQERVSSMSLVLLVYQFGSSFSFVYLLACCLTPRSTSRRPDDDRRSEPIRIVCHAIAFGAFDETAQCELRWPRIVVRRASAASNNYITWPKAAGRLRSVHDLMKVVYFLFKLD